MGYISALDMNARLPLRHAVAWHLRCNCYPPVQRVAIAAIRAVRARDYAREVRLPAGVRLRDSHARTATAARVIEGLHLHAFVDADVPE